MGVYERYPIKIIKIDWEKVVDTQNLRFLHNLLYKARTKNIGRTGPKILKGKMQENVHYGPKNKTKSIESIKLVEVIIGHKAE